MPSDGVVWRGWLRFGGSHRIQLSLHVFFVVTIVAVTYMLAAAFLPRMFPGWAGAVYWLVAVAVTLTDSLAGLLHELGHAAAALARGRYVYRITLYGLSAAAHRSGGPGRPRAQLALAHLFRGRPGAIHRALGVLAQVFRHTRVGHQELGVADRQRQLVGDPILHRVGRHTCAFETRGFGFGSAPSVFGTQVHRDVQDDGPAGDENHGQRESLAELLGQFLAAL